MSEVSTLRAELAEMRAERDLLQEILDHRPAINAGLPETYIMWTRAIYTGEAYRAAHGHHGPSEPDGKPREDGA